MSNIILLGDKKHNKDCPDWTPLKDGTLTGDTRYCDLSLQCRQIGMRSDWYHFTTELGEQSFDYFCLGEKPNEENKRDDKEVS